MNSFWKGVSLTIILLIGLVVVYNIFIRHTEFQNDMAVQNQEEYPVSYTHLRAHET